MSVRVLVALLATLTLGCEARARFESHPSDTATPTTTTTIAVDQRASAILAPEKPEEPTAEVVLEKAGRVRLWKRAKGDCYLSIDVVGWESIYIDVSGPICEKARPNRVELKRQ